MLTYLAWWNLFTLVYRRVRERERERERERNVKNDNRQIEKIGSWNHGVPVQINNIKDCGCFIYRNCFITHAVTGPSLLLVITTVCNSVHNQHHHVLWIFYSTIFTENISILLWCCEILRCYHNYLQPYMYTVLGNIYIYIYIYMYIYIYIGTYIKHDLFHICHNNYNTFINFYQTLNIMNEEIYIFLLYLCYGHC